MQAWGLRNLITEFARAARRPHVPREPAMRSLYISAGIPLPEGSLSSHEKVKPSSEKKTGVSHLATSINMN